MIQKMKQNVADFANKIDDWNTLGDDDMNVFEEWDPEYMPDTIVLKCKGCGLVRRFVGKRSKTTDTSTYVLFTMINDKPTIMIRKIYECSWCKHRVTVTSIFEEVGHTQEEGDHPIIFSKYMQHED